MVQKKYTYKIVLLTLLLTSLACSIPLGGSSADTPPIANTEQAIVLPTSPPTGLPPSGAPAPLIPEKEGAEAPPPGSPGDLNTPSVSQSKSGMLPAAVLLDAGQTDQDGVALLTFFNLEGQPITSLQTPGLLMGETRFVHTAGSMPPGEINTPLVYYAYGEDPAIRLNINNNIDELLYSGHLYAMAGAPAKALVAYSNLILDGTETTSELYVGTLQNLPEAQPSLRKTETEGNPYVPLMVTANNNDEPQGVWFTTEAWGYGGGIVFPPRTGLYYLDMETLQETTYLGEERNLSSISPDGTLAASTAADSGGDHTLTVQLLITASVSFNYPLAEGMDRGAGFAVFSPDSQSVAWMEGAGEVMGNPPTFTSRVRAALVDGDILVDLSDNQLADTGGLASSDLTKPVGWLDNQTVLIQLYDEGSATLLRLNVENGDISTFANGSFVAFVYP